MKPPNKSKPKVAGRGRSKKTKADFLRWLKERRALERQTAGNGTAETTDEMKKALTVWVDDGGAVA